MRQALIFAFSTLCIVTYFLTFSGQGLSAGLTHDDLMNLYLSWRAPIEEHLRDIVCFFRFSRSYRPAGALFYRLVFEDFGFNPLPFRIACYALLLANLWLAYALVRRLANSHVAALTVLLYAYHREFWPLYTNTGTCYDLLCFLFYAWAFLYYLRARQRRLPLPWFRVAGWSCLYVLCLNSKEMAVSLPAVIGVFELLASPPASWRPRRLAAWLLREGRVPLTGAALTVAYLAGRIWAPEGLPGMAAYRPELSLAVYLDRARWWLWRVLYDPGWLTPPVAGLLLLLVLVAAARRRSLPLRLSVAWMLIGILPVAFIPQRGLYAAYIPGLGLALCLAVGVEALAKGLARRALRFRDLFVWRADRWPVPAAAPPRRWRPIVTFASVLLALVAVHRLYGRISFHEVNAEARHIGCVYQQLRAGGTVFPGRSRILFLRDPFQESEWASTFLVGLYSRDSTLNVFRADRLIRDFNKNDVLDFDYAFTWEGDRLLACDAGPFRRVSVRDLPDRMRVAVCRAQERPASRDLAGMARCRW